MEILLSIGGRRLCSDYVAHERQQLQISQKIKALRQQVTNLYRAKQSLHKRILALQSLVFYNGKKLDATKRDCA